MPRKKLDPAERAQSEQAGQLLDASIAHVLANGLGDLSLRHIAEAIGSSHRMLIYYFGSSDGFWQRLLLRLRSQEEARLDGWVDTSSAASEGIEKAWNHFSAPAYLPVMQLLIEIFGRAIHDPQRFRPFLDGVVGSSTRRLTRILQARYGLDEQDARVRARLEMATVRGLMLDLLTTDSRDEVVAALHYFARLMDMDSRDRKPASGEA